MRLWLPFAVSNKATVFELYYADLGLAFDPSYCTSMTACYNPQFQPTSTEWNWFELVGQGTGCGGVLGTGDCSYASTINTEHGFH
jgi:hypothetical protein